VYVIKGDWSSDVCSSDLLAVLLAAMITGCAGRQVMIETTPLASGNSIITIEASSYKFKPNDIHVAKPGTLALEIKNVSGTEHNFTLKDSQGKILKNLNIRPKETAISNVDLGPGTYEFYCDKRFHTTLGMKGRVVVGGAK
jgi:plastocyanin